MYENRKILLEATLGDKIGPLAFRAKLENGHEFAAFLTRGCGISMEDCSNVSGVQVSMSSFDMSKGAIVALSECLETSEI